MADNYQHHPDPSYGIELRDGWTTDDYIANARGFRSTREFIEYRDSSEEHRAAMRRDRDARDKREDDNEDLRRYAEFLKVCDYE